MILHIGNSKDIFRKLLQFINEFSIFARYIFARYKIDIQKYVNISVYAIYLLHFYTTTK